MTQSEKAELKAEMLKISRSHAAGGNHLANAKEMYDWLTEGVEDTEEEETEETDKPASGWDKFWAVIGILSGVLFLLYGVLYFLKGELVAGFGCGLLGVNWIVDNALKEVW